MKTPVLPVIFGLALLASAGMARADGKKLAATRCAACHGADGVSVMAGVPTLAAQKRGYLLAQLRAFRDGARRDPSMQAAVAGLDDEALDRLARYFAGLSSPLPRPPASDAPGRNAAAICTPCHGAFGVSGNDAWPNLAGQRSDYLEAQLQAFASGKRRDVVMSRMAGSLDVESIAAVSRYFEALRTARLSPAGAPDPAAAREPPP
jgi:cytochrome c553